MTGLVWPHPEVSQAKPVISDHKQNGSPMRCQASVSLERGPKILLNLLE